MKIAASCRKDILTGFADRDLLFAFFEIGKGRIISVSETAFAAGTIEQCADFLVKNEVDLLLAPTLKSREKEILDDAGIHLIDNLTGSVRTLVEAYIKGVLFDNPEYFTN